MRDESTQVQRSAGQTKVMQEIGTGVLVVGLSRQVPALALLGYANGYLHLLLQVIRPLPRSFIALPFSSVADIAGSTLGKARRRLEVRMAAWEEPGYCSSTLDGGS